MKHILLSVVLFAGTQLVAQNTAKNILPAGNKTHASRKDEASATLSHMMKTDKVFFLNGSTKEGKVVAFENDQVQFIHEGETLNYAFNKNEIERIEFSSGRIEMLHEKRSIDISNTLVVKKNKVAVLPIGYIADASDTKMEEMRFSLQELVTSFLSKSAGELKFQDPVNINALLLKSGINDNNIRQYTVKELADILQVEYIIMGTVMQDKGNLTTITNSHSTSRQSREQKYDENKSRERNNSNRVTRTNQDIETEVSLSIYNEAGENIYNKSRHSMLSDVNAYKATLHYLLKRTPLYER